MAGVSRVGPRQPKLEALPKSEGQALKKSSPLQEHLVGTLSGQEYIDEFAEMGAMFRAHGLTDTVKGSQRKLVLAQLDEALKVLDSPAKGPRPWGKAYTARDLEEIRSFIHISSARLRQPEVAGLVDAFANVKGACLPPDRPFTYATFADTGVSQAKFKQLTEAAQKSVAQGGPAAAADVALIWNSVKAAVGSTVSIHHPAKGFDRLQYSGDPSGPSFREDVASFEKLLGKGPARGWAPVRTE